MNRDFDHLDTTDIARKLTEWFSSHARSLPWRSEYEPYKVWVAEIMLQQTTIAACIPYFERFIQVFPTLESLAAASEDKVLTLWSGLGYYTRARNLMKTARILLEQYNGHFPDELSELKSLPGIGDYTAGAIRSIALNRPAPMVDANVRRVLGRVLGLSPDAPEAEKNIAVFSLRISESGEPRIINQSLMEVGSLACFPKEPACCNCPFNSVCQALKSGDYECYGSVNKSEEVIPVQEVCVVATLDFQYLLSRPQDGRWRGLWEFPRIQVNDSETPSEAASRLLEDILRVDCEHLKTVGKIRHRVTRYDITLHVMGTQLAGEPLADKSIWRLESSHVLPDLPMPSPMRRIARKLIPSNGVQMRLIEGEHNL